MGRGGNRVCSCLLHPSDSILANLEFRVVAAVEVADAGEEAVVAEAEVVAEGETTDGTTHAQRSRDPTKAWRNTTTP